MGGGGKQPAIWRGGSILQTVPVELSLACGWCATTLPWTEGKDRSGVRGSGHCAKEQASNTLVSWQVDGVLMFCKYDLDRSGFLDRAEFLLMMQELASEWIQPHFE